MYNSLDELCSMICAFLNRLFQKERRFLSFAINLGFSLKLGELHILFFVEISPMYL